MFRVPIVLLRCFALRDASTAPTHLATLHLPPDVSIGEARLSHEPIQFTLSRNGQVQLRHRKLFEPNPVMTEPPAIPNKMDHYGNKLRKPSPNETILIEDFLRKNFVGRAYWMDGNGNFYLKLKPEFTLRYYCGKFEVYDTEDYLIYSTPFWSNHDQKLSGICCACDTCTEFWATIAGCAACPRGNCACTIMYHVAPQVYEATCDALARMERAGSSAMKSIQTAGSNALQSTKEATFKTAGVIKETSSRAAEKIKATKSSATEWMQKATSRHSEGPMNYIELSKSDTPSVAVQEHPTKPDQQIVEMPEDDLQFQSSTRSS
ncbi:hypothetical protein Pst134EA_000923 [Puccinia striiformis f. sp. tritici]|uniref:hypothetical protein n=1 Tax=Puccinia striiformis f. sp. tritici TaxID=168172 RepID=UPI0020074AF5|nr:hypothetical protein Pst134EA_000923 [Puccinia striiformis f. sp. tritici]KAH9473861.1 hypothetical protein Pst134EA_000923 [Puccinia striiformis f. sp. tritici]